MGCGEWEISFIAVNTWLHLEKAKGIKEQFKGILATVIRVKRRKESKSRITARLTSESSL
jgi:hypothetical protein